MHSPRALPNGVTVEKAKDGLRVPRNSNIVNVLRDYDFMEHRGMGIRRKVIPLTRAHNGTDPEFDATEDYFKVTLRKDVPGGGRRDLVLGLLLWRRKSIRPCRTNHYEGSAIHTVLSVRRHPHDA